jgi:heme-degrading monooxygenase HmoA
LAQDAFLRRLEELPGFRQYHLIEGDDGNHIASISVFDTREGAQASEELAAEWVQTGLGAARLSKPTITEGSVLVSSSRSQEPASVSGE